MAVMADKGPYFIAGSPGGDGSTQDTRSQIGPPRPTGNAERVLRISNDEWRPYNSRNHNGEGQNVLFMDDHVTFEKKPLAGVNNDNIFTRQLTNYVFKGTLTGDLPEDNEGPWTATDTIIVP